MRASHAAYACPSPIPCYTCRMANIPASDGELSDELRAALSALGKRRAASFTSASQSAAAKARSAGMTSDERIAQARSAAQARWKRKRHKLPPER